MARGGENGSHIRKKYRANAMGHQWWRKLSLPRRGKKDSMLTPVELSTAQHDRFLTHHAALSKALHAPRTARQKHMARAVWESDVQKARVTEIKGGGINSMGDFEGGDLMLRPEEVLYLVERGTLDLLVERHAASIQRTWALTMSCKHSLSTDEYLAYAHLRRSGYAVRRYERKHGTVCDEIRVSFSVWRTSGFKRKGDVPPLFYVCVWQYEDGAATILDTCKLSTCCGNRPRVKFAMVERGIVNFIDISSNATPLSPRFVKRLGVGEQNAVNELEKGALDERLKEAELVESMDE